MGREGIGWEQRALNRRDHGSSRANEPHLVSEWLRVVLVMPTKSWWCLRRLLVWPNFFNGWMQRSDMQREITVRQFPKRRNAGRDNRLRAALWRAVAGNHSSFFLFYVLYFSSDHWLRTHYSALNVNRWLIPFVFRCRTSRYTHLIEDVGAPGAL